MPSNGAACYEESVLSILLAATPLIAAEDGFTPLFNTKDLTAWRASEHPNTFSLKDGAVAAHGPRSRCFYAGKFHQHTFKDFELKVDILTMPHRCGLPAIATGSLPCRRRYGF